MFIYKVKSSSNEFWCKTTRIFAQEGGTIYTDLKALVRDLSRQKTHTKKILGYYTRNGYVNNSDHFRRLQQLDNALSNCTIIKYDLVQVEELDSKGHHLETESAQESVHDIEKIDFSAI